MKIFLLLGLLTASSLAQTDDVDKLVGKAFQDAADKRIAGHEKANRDYRAAIATMFKYADRVEIFLLDPAGGLDNDEASYDAVAFRCDLIRTKGTRILKQKTVPARDIPKWCAATTKLLTSEKPDDSGEFRHVPVHGIRIWAHKRAIFETSFCWDCQTYYFDYEGGAQWGNINQDGADLEKLLRKALPVLPPEKIDKIREKLFAEEARKAKVRKARWAREDEAKAAKAAKEAAEAKAKEAREAKEAEATKAREAAEAKAKETQE